MYYRGLRLHAGAATHGNYRLGLSYYRRFSSSWASSLSASGSRREGYFRNSHNGARADREHNESLRWRTIFRPSSALSIENVASYNHAHPERLPLCLGRKRTHRLQRPDLLPTHSLHRRSDHHTDHPAFTLASITGFQYLSDNMTLDRDFLPESYFTLTRKQRDRNVTGTSSSAEKPVTTAGSQESSASTNMPTSTPQSPSRKTESTA